MSSRRAKHFYMLFNFAVKTQLKSTHAHLTKKRLLFFSGNDLFSEKPLVRIS